MSKLIGRLLVVLAFGWAGSVWATIISVEPDDFSDGTDISSAFQGVFLSSFGGAAGSQIYSATINNVQAPYAPIPSTGTRVFGHDGPNNISWKTPGTGAPNDPWGFQAEFLSPISYFSIDVLWYYAGGNPTYNRVGEIRVFDATDNLLASLELPSINSQSFITASLTRSEADIAYFQLVTSQSNGIALDHLTYSNSDPSTVTVPLPATYPLLGLGLAALGYSRRNRKQHNLAA